MSRTVVRRPFVCLLALAACSTASPVSPALAELMAEAPEAQPSRLSIEGNVIVAAAVTVGPGELPEPVRTMIEAVTPRGQLVFQGREWGPRGEGFRIEKHYSEGPVEHTRSALIAADGAVLERWHSVPIPQVPQHVLAAAMLTSGQIEEARIVSGRTQEEYWSCTVRDRLGRTFVVEVGLDGRFLRRLRRVEARVEV